MIICAQLLAFLMPIVGTFYFTTVFKLIHSMKFQPIYLFFQGASKLKDAEAEEVSQSVLDVILGSGPLGIAILAILIFLSAIGTYIFLERLFTIKKATSVDQNFMNNIRSSVLAGNIPGAKAL